MSINNGTVINVKHVRLRALLEACLFAVFMFQMGRYGDDDCNMYMNHVLVRNPHSSGSKAKVSDTGNPCASDSETRVV